MLRRNRCNRACIAVWLSRRHVARARARLHVCSRIKKSVGRIYGLIRRGQVVEDGAHTHTHVDTFGWSIAIRFSQPPWNVSISALGVCLPVAAGRLRTGLLCSSLPDDLHTYAIHADPPSCRASSSTRRVHVDDVSSRDILTESTCASISQTENFP